MIVFDLETQNLAVEVGGFGNRNLLRLSVACTWDEFNGYRVWWEAQAVDLIDELRRAELIVGFNVNRFDFDVLSYYGDTRDLFNKSFDILGEISFQGKRRISQRQLASINLDTAIPQESGVVAVALWRQGRLDELIRKCQLDVELSKRLFEKWQTEGLLWVSATDYVVWPDVAEVLRRKE